MAEVKRWEEADITHFPLACKGNSSVMEAEAGKPLSHALIEGAIEKMVKQTTNPK